MSSIPTPSWLKIPPWLDELAPGAADTARIIANDPTLSDVRSERLQRLVRGTQSAWKELPVRRRNDKHKLSADKLREAQSNLMTTAFYAAEFAPMGQREIKRVKSRIEKLGITASKLAREISETSNDLQLMGLWQLRFAEAAQDLGRIADLFSDIAELYRHEGPVTPVGQPLGKNSRKTTVIRKLASVFKAHFGMTHYGAVATLTNASLDRTDIDEQTVRKSLPKS